MKIDDFHTCFVMTVISASLSHSNGPPLAAMLVWHKINSNHARVLGSPIFTLNCTHFSSASWVIHQSLDLDERGR